MWQKLSSFSNSYVVVTYVRWKPLIFQTFHPENSLLKYQRFMTPGCKNIWINKLGFVAKTHFLFQRCLQKSLKLLDQWGFKARFKKIELKKIVLLCHLWYKPLLGNIALPRVLIVTSAVYPHFVNFDLYFRFKSRPIQIRISKPSLEQSHGSSEFPIKICGKSVQGFLSYKRTNKQTSRK